MRAGLALQLQLQQRSLAPTHQQWHRALRLQAPLILTAPDTAHAGAEKADGSGKRKREPIPVFKTRERRAPEAAQKDGAEKKGAAAADGREAKIARTDSTSDKRSSVFERLNSKVLPYFVLVTCSQAFPPHG